MSLYCAIAGPVSAPTRFGTIRRTGFRSTWGRTWRECLGCALVVWLALTGHALMASDEAWEALDAEAIELALSGELGSAREVAEKALALARKDFGSDGRTARSLSLLAELHILEKNWADAEALLLEGKKIRQLALDPHDPMHEESLNLLGTVYMRSGRLDEAERSFLASKELARKAAELGLEGPFAPRWTDLITSLELLADLQRQRGDNVAMQRTHAEIVETVVHYAPAYGTWRASDELRGQREQFQVRGDPTGAERAEGVMEIALRKEAVHAEQSGDALAQAEALHELARIASRAGRYANEAALDSDAYRLAHSALDTDDARLVKFLRYGSESEKHAGRKAEAEAMLRQALLIVASTEPDDAYSDFDVAYISFLLADILEADGHLDQAERLRRRALSIYQTVYGPSAWMTAWHLRLLGDNLMGQGRWDDAEAQFQAAVAATPTDTRLTESDYLLSWLQLARIAAHRGDFPALAQRWWEVVALRAEDLGQDAPETRAGLRELSALTRVIGGDLPDLPDPVEGIERVKSSPEVSAMHSLTIEGMVSNLARRVEPTEPQLRIAWLSVEAELLAARDESLLAAESYQQALDLAVEHHADQNGKHRAIAGRLAELYRSAMKPELAAALSRRFELSDTAE